MEGQLLGQNPTQWPFALNFNYNSVTTGTTVDNTIPEQWSRELEDYVKPRRFMARFAVEKTDLIKKEGDTVKISKRTQLTATGDLTETTQLVGNEEKMTFSQVSFVPAERGNAVAWTGQAASKSIVDLRTEARIALGDWAATKIDNDLHTAAQNVTGRIYGGGRANMQLLQAADTMTPQLISKAKAILQGRKVPGFQAGNRDEPGADRDGYYVMIMHPFQLYDLTQHSDYKTAASHLALIQSQVSNMFWGFKGYWDGVLIYATTQIYYANPGAYTVKVGKAIMFGPRFLARAVGIFQQGPGYIWAENNWDYGRATGVAVRWYDQAKILNAERGIGVYTAATDLTL